MSQFSKEPPWVRDKARLSGKSGGFGHVPTSQLGIASQSAFSQTAMGSSALFTLPQPGVAMPTSLATSQISAISYPAARTISSSNQPSLPPQQQQKTFTDLQSAASGHVGDMILSVQRETRPLVVVYMHCESENNNHALDSVKGAAPQLGDKVVVDALYNAGMPFKWNATRVQLTQPSIQVSAGTFQSAITQPPVGVGIGSSFPSVGTLTPAAVAQVGAVYQAAAAAAYQAVAASGLMGLNQNASPIGPGQSQAIIGRQISGGRRTEGLREYDRSRVRERRSPRKRSRSPVQRRARSPRRSRSPLPRARSKSRSRSRSSTPKRHSVRSSSRYSVQIPKFTLDLKEADVVTIRARYSNLYIPSDFFNARTVWTDVFPLHRPFELGHACQFHVMDKSAAAPPSNDADETVPVLGPSDVDYRYSAKVMLLSMPSLEDLYSHSCSLAELSDSGPSQQHPARLIQFLVGLRGKSEPMAIGGPWSPSLDGPNPESDPRVLINTAIRTTKFLTGIDLSRCTKWYRFTEIRYHRQLAGRTAPQIETVVLYLPDVWTCCPTRLDWHASVDAYRSYLESKLLTAARDDDDVKLESKDDEMTEKEETYEKKDPAHYSELDPKNMKVSSLRQELEGRGLSTKGLRSQLVARLMKVLKSEQEKEEGRDTEKDKKEDDYMKFDLGDKDSLHKTKEEEERRIGRERDFEKLERKYALPLDPHILVHPSPTAKSGRFDCAMMSLSVLLDYRPEDNKEHSFEVSLFAEQFNEMLMRDCAFRIYKALVVAPEKLEDVKKDEKKKQDEKSKLTAEELSEHDQQIDSDTRKDGASGNHEPVRASAAVELREITKENDELSNPEKKRILDAEAATVEKEVKPEKQDYVNEPDRSDKKGRKRSRWSAVAEEKIDEDTGSRNERNEKGIDSEKKFVSKTSKSSEEKDRMITADPGLLLAFVYFDLTHCGYILEKDLEDLLHIIGLHLSRSQVKKLIAKLLISTQQLHYRKLTDKTLSKEDSYATASDTATCAEIDDECLAKGNRLPAQLSIDNESKSSHDSPSGGVVMLNGALVNIDSVLQNLNHSEKARIEIEAMLKLVEEECATLKTSFKASELSRQKLLVERDALDQKVGDQQREIECKEATSRSLREVLSRVLTTMSSLSNDIQTAVSGPHQQLPASSLERTEQ